VVVSRYQGEADDIDIGFWEVTGLSANYSDQLDTMARLVVTMNLDVWVFEGPSRDAAALVKRLNTTFRGDYDCAVSGAAGPEAPTTTVLWNNKTIRGTNEAWPGALDPWFHIDGHDFAGLGLEVGDGPVFDGCPGLYHFTAKNRANGRGPFAFYLVPLHLAGPKGSGRRRLAVKALAAALGKMIHEYRKGPDWIVGGSFDAATANEDFRDLIGPGVVPFSAGNEEGGAFSYLKRPRSLLERILLCNNLTRTCGEGAFHCCAERHMPEEVRALSARAPILVRLSLLARQADARAARRKRRAEGTGAAVAELRRALSGGVGKDNERAGGA
jgi:hypothetical protein